MPAAAKMANRILSLVAALVFFAIIDHVQPAADKPRSNQALDGIHNAAGIWCRLNPDRDYAAWVNPPSGLLADPGA